MSVGIFPFRIQLVPQGRDCWACLQGFCTVQLNEEWRKEGKNLPDEATQAASCYVFGVVEVLRALQLCGGTIPLCERDAKHFSLTAKALGVQLFKGDPGMVQQKPTPGAPS
jgi:hypothetical protein